MLRPLQISWFPFLKLPNNVPMYLTLSLQDHNAQSNVKTMTFVFPVTLAFLSAELWISKSKPLWYITFFKFDLLTIYFGKHTLFNSSVIILYDFFLNNLKWLKIKTKIFLMFIPDSIILPFRRCVLYSHICI